MLMTLIYQPTILQHYTDNKLLLLPKIYKQGNYLPNGFWFSKNDEWKKWCIENDFHNGISICYCIAISLTKIYIVDTIPKLLNLITNYSYIVGKINWDIFQEDFNGIYFDNYDYIMSILVSSKLINLCKWYRTISVNSGCIFNTKSIIEYVQVL
jgi:hypothetical protein